MPYGTPLGPSSGSWLGRRPNGDDPRPCHPVVQRDPAHERRQDHGGEQEHRRHAQHHRDPGRRSGTSEPCRRPMPRMIWGMAPMDPRQPSADDDPMRVLTEKRSSPRGQRHRGWLVAAALIATTLLMGCGPSVPPDPLSASSVEARAAKVQQMDAAIAEVVGILDGEVLGTSSVDECYAGQRNWKVDTGYDERCSLLIGTLIGVEGDVRTLMLAADAALEERRWQSPNGQWPGQLVDEYWDLRAGESADGGVLLHRLPGPLSLHRDDLRLGFDYGDAGAGAGLDRLDRAQRSTMWCCGAPFFERRQLIDVGRAAQDARQQQLILVTVEGHYVET